MATVLDVIKGLNQAAANAYDGALDENGDTLEEWRLNNPFITALAMNEYSYEGEELSTVDVTFRYDWASYEIPAGRAQDPGGLTERRLFTPGGS